MISAFHGKYYYMELPNNDYARIAQDLISNSDSLKDEIFEICYIDGRVVIVSDAAVCGKNGPGFRGNKYHEWERIKNTMYKLIKEGA